MSDDGGDPACWAEHVCDACGALAAGGHHCVRGARLDMPAAAGDGVIWALAGRRQLEANLVALSGGASVGEHANDELDVLMIGVAGVLTVTIDGVDRRLAAGELLLVPRRARRALTADPDGARYLTVHVAGAGPQIRKLR